MELTKEEIVKVFAIYWNATYVRDGIIAKPSYKVCAGVLLDIEQSGKEDRIILLSELSGIKNDDAIELVCRSDYKRTIENPVVKILPGGVNISNNSGGVSLFWHSLNHKEWIYLKDKKYAVPLYFGIDHWANGKTAIELKIAKAI